MIPLLLKRRLRVKIWNLEIHILRKLLCKYRPLRVRLLCLNTCFVYLAVLLLVHHVICFIKICVSFYVKSSYVIVYCVKLDDVTFCNVMLHCVKYYPTISHDVTKYRQWLFHFSFESSVLPVYTIKLSIHRISFYHFYKI